MNDADCFSPPPLRFKPPRLHSVPADLHIAPAARVVLAGIKEEPLAIRISACAQLVHIL
jgi:hypothetical protein